MDSEDVACVARIAQGDQAALGELYERYYRRLFRYLWHQMHGDASLAEEAVQDTFVSVWRAAGTFRGESRVATWLFRIAQRCCGRVSRMHPQQKQPISLSQAQAVEDETAPPGHEDQTLTRLALQEALLRLSDKQREVVLLTLVHQFTSEEAAQILKVPSGTIRSRLRAARTLLLNDPALCQIEEVGS
jgi:RNA polymerase sigma factor (sigma-70 family)